MTKTIKAILQAEAFVIWLATLYFYNQTGYSWWWYGLFLAFDVSMIGYYGNNKIRGSRMYNFGHSYVVPVILLVYAFENGEQLMSVISIMWISHIAFDRAQGYGLKQEKGFTHTHLGKIGTPSRLKGRQ